MGVTGIPKSKWDETPESTGYDVFPAGVGLEFEIEAIKEGVDKNNAEFVSVGCVHYTDEGAKRYKWEYFALTNERLPFLKTFLKGIGRADLMHEDADWEDLKGTQFEADCVHNTGKKDGKVYANLDYNTIVAVSHNCFDPTEVEEGQTEDEGETKAVGRQSTKKPVPKRAPRARSAARG